MVKRFEETGHSQILVEEVPQDQVINTVLSIVLVQIAEGKTAPIKGMVEKPAIDEAPSNMAIVGRYVLSKKVWDLLRHNLVPVVKFN